MAASKTLSEKVWDRHVVARGADSAPGEPDLLYIDLHLVHEVTSPQAFDGLRLEGRPVRRPDRTLATADHNVPTDGTAAAIHIRDELSRLQVETLERNCEEFGIPIYSLGSDRQGIVLFGAVALHKKTFPSVDLPVLCKPHDVARYVLLWPSLSASSPPKSSKISFNCVAIRLNEYQSRADGRHIAVR